MACARVYALQIGATEQVHKGGGPTRESAFGMKLWPTTVVDGSVIARKVTVAPQWCLGTSQVGRIDMRMVQLLEVNGCWSETLLEKY